MIIRLRILFLTWFVFLFVYCKNNVIEPDNYSEIPSHHGRIIPPVLDSLIRNHGSWNQWKEMKTLHFLVQTDLHNFGNEVHSVHLMERGINITGEHHKITFDDFSTTMSLQVPELLGLEPVQYAGMMYYILCFPFIALDDGIIYQVNSNHDYNEKPYHILTLTYDPRKYPDRKDRFELFIHSDNYQLEKVVYAEYPNQDAQSLQMTINFLKWQDVRNFRLPYHVEIHIEPHETPKNIIFSDITLTEDDPGERF